MDRKQETPRFAQVHAAHDQVGVRVGGGEGCGVSEAHPQRPATMLASLFVQQDVPGDAEDPRSSAITETRHLNEATPHDQERVCDHVFGVIWVCAALNESREVRLDQLVQRLEGVLPVSSPRSVTHTPYLSPTPVSVSQQVPRRPSLRQISRSPARQTNIFEANDTV